MEQPPRLVQENKRSIKQSTKDLIQAPESTFETGPYHPRHHMSIPKNSSTPEQVQPNKAKKGLVSKMQRHQPVSLPTVYDAYYE